MLSVLLNKTFLSLSDTVIEMTKGRRLLCFNQGEGRADGPSDQRENEAAGHVPA